MDQNPSVKPVDPLSLRGLPSHAETHWLTFATAMRCYARQPTRPALDASADRHGPSWLRSALRKEAPPPRQQQRPREFEPDTGSLAFLTAGAEEALKPPKEPAPPPAPACEPKLALSHLTEETRLGSARVPAHHSDTWASSSLDAASRDRMGRFLAMAAARADITRRL